MRLDAIPFRRSTLLLNLREDTLGLIVDTVSTRRHLAITLDLFLPAHITGLLEFRSAHNTL
jgi:hypothetical protein